MSIPDSQETATSDNPSVDSTPSLEEQLAVAEKRRKDTVSAYTKGQQELKALQAENAKLLEIASQQRTISLTEDEQVALDNLKYEDPDAWRKKVNSLELEAGNKARANLDELTSEAKNAAEREFELERRQQVLKEFNESAEIAITEELIANEVPPRITNKLAEGKISFEDFLQEVSTYVGTGKVVKNPDVLDQPNLGNLGGGITPTDMKPEKSLSASYKTDIY